MARHQLRRHETVDIVLRDEGFEHGDLGLHALGDGGGVIDMRWKVRAVAEVPAAAHHRQIDAGAPTFDLNRQDVGVLRRHAGVVFDRLLVQHL